MRLDNLLDFNNRSEFRKWLMENSSSEKECWLPVRRGRTPPEDCIWYLDAVEEALCFGWIDSTQKNINGVIYQRFGPRRKGGRWTELNKERCRRLEKLGLMTDLGRKVCPDLNEDFIIERDVLEIFKSNPTAGITSKPYPHYIKESGLIIYRIFVVQNSLSPDFQDLLKQARKAR